MGQHMGHMRRQHTGQITGQLCQHPEDMQMDHLHPLGIPTYRASYAVTPPDAIAIAECRPIYRIAVSGFLAPKTREDVVAFSHASGRRGHHTALVARGRHAIRIDRMMMVERRVTPSDA
jgi:hypothetical protein